MTGVMMIMVIVEKMMSLMRVRSSRMQVISERMMSQFPNSPNSGAHALYAVMMQRTTASL
jgi:hypothetical protein